ncbi:hypothetical protein MWN41_07730 [Ornithobacterium rhinotracheale]|uniref:hypothetical protein n=1 Tax=Ornithobacterium rhinotracheale TaxID=28251 RepID=UPI001FF4F2E3|nr:hypothetical protein [Ornithobacterium rhinotracheale]MCK0202904.1 hypothetical protein [Ornithobacterium rhinotracheale]
MKALTSEGFFVRKRFLSQREGSRDIAGAFAFIRGIVRVCRCERSRRATGTLA